VEANIGMPTDNASAAARRINQNGVELFSIPPDTGL
tara:strand:+ start:762 stop:869 length:108 start_codon:yes stop_codon:yes gene_type:complete